MIRAVGRILPALFVVVLIAAAVVLTRGSRFEALQAPATLAQTESEQAQFSTPTYFGSLEVGRLRALAPGVGGEVLELLVDVGDSVQEGQQLMRLDTTQLDLSLQRAEIALELARVALLEINEQSSETELAVAEANLELARSNLAELEAGGATKEEVAALQARANAAWARYNEILAGPSQARLQQLHATVERAEVEVTQAQRAYNEISWRGDAGGTPQAASLHRATIDLNVAQAAYAEATQPPRTSEVQGAMATAQLAQHALNELEKGVSEVNMAVGRAQVRAAQATVERIKELTRSRRSAELRVSRALIDLEEAQRRLDKAQVRAPFAGTVLALNVAEGQMVGVATTVAEIGDTSALELVVGIPQDQVLTMSVGDPVRITRFGSDEISVMSTIHKISPISVPGKGNSTFPVTIRLPQEGTARFNPGIFVSATFE